MRRLSEILSFPRAWYRRNLARKLFLGDESWALEDEGMKCSLSGNLIRVFGLLKISRAVW